MSEKVLKKALERQDIEGLFRLGDQSSIGHVDRPKEGNGFAGRSHEQDGEVGDVV